MKPESLQQDILSALTIEQQKLVSIFHPYAWERTLAAISKPMRFVHYTTAETALQIFKNEEFWMRNSSCMNDFMEIEYGFERLNASFKRHQERLKKSLDGPFPGFCDRLQELFNSWLPHLRSETYIACVSEHGDEHSPDLEDRIGRLSMWRAYGGNSGVAIVLNSGPFLRPSDALNAYTSPVAYLDQDGFDNEFSRLLKNVEDHMDFLEETGEEIVLNQMFEAFRSSILCTKHPGFREEREWRVVHTPSMNKSERLKQDIVSIRGTPQEVYKIPLKNFEEEGLYGVTLAEVIDRVVIGPTNFPVATRNALCKTLAEKGVPDAHSKVFISDIPLR